MKQGRLRDRAPGGRRANVAALERPVADLLDHFEAVARGAFVFVERHEDVPTTPAPSSQLNVAAFPFLGPIAWGRIEFPTKTEPGFLAGDLR